MTNSITLKRWSHAVAVVLVAVAGAQAARADSKAYDEVVQLQAQGSDFRVVHRHDWSRATLKKRTAMMATHQDPFHGDNTFAHLAWHSRDGKLIRRLPSPALSWLGVSADSRYVIGLSHIALDNPYHLVVWSRDGEVLVKRRIAPRVACLAPATYRDLRRAHAKEFDALAGRTWTAGGTVYVDFLAKGMPERLGKLWGELLSKSCASPWSSNFSESVTNWITWYEFEDPSPIVVETAGKATALRLKDPEGKTITIPFHLERPSP